MNEWWNSLDTLNKAFYIGAGFFSILFLWQFLATLIGLAGDGGADVDVDADLDVDGLDLDDIESGAIEEAAESIAAFKVFSLRAILAFCTLFCWAGALYLQDEFSTEAAMGYASIWGFGAWFLVALTLTYVYRLAETGNRKLRTCVGTDGTVYLNIPANGPGEVRVTVSGVISRVTARSAGGVAIAAGTPIHVKRTIGPNTVVVEVIEDIGNEEGNES